MGVAGDGNQLATNETDPCDSHHSGGAVGIDVMCLNISRERTVLRACRGHAVHLLSRQRITRLIAVNWISHGLTPP